MEAVTTQTDRAETTECKYKGCRQPGRGDQDLCFWHDPECEKADDKSSDDIVSRLQELAYEGHSLRGFQLQRANLQGLRLVCKDKSQSVDLSFANLYRADLRGAHLYQVNLHRADLLKADLSEANLNFSDLSGANLLGTRFDRCRMEHVNWGRFIHQELLIKEREPGKGQVSDKQLRGEAEEVCRNVRQSCEVHGLFEEAGHFFYKEMVQRRKQHPLDSWQRWVSKLVDLFCGYGERPLRVMIFSSFMIFLCALFYFISGIVGDGELIRFEFHTPWTVNFESFLNALYFSVVTFTTLGYGDLVPVGPSRTLAALQAFLGNFTMALFVVVFVKKMAR